MLMFFWHTLCTKLDFECLSDSFSTFLREIIWLTTDSVRIELDVVLLAGCLVFGVIDFYREKVLQSLDPVLLNRLLKPDSLGQLCLLVSW